MATFKTPAIKTSATVSLMDCPACKKPISALVQITGSLSKEGVLDNNTKLMIEGNIAGLQVYHDCLPRVTRSTQGE